MGTPAPAKTNSEESVETALTVYDGRQQAVLRSAIELWASASTAVESRRRDEVLRNKRKIVQSFFDWVKKNPGLVEPTDVHA